MDFTRWETIVARRELILIRHGRVDMDYDKAIDSEELYEWLKLYDSAPLDEESLPPDRVLESVMRCGYVMTSTKGRTLASAHRIGCSVDVSESIFDEAEVSEIHLPLLKMKPWSWLWLLRIVMSLGYVDRRGISLANARKRAEEGALKLEKTTLEYGAVALVGHGGMNWLIGKVLEDRGWKCVEKSNLNWGISRFVI
jgi:broad specificity phosphatase PhoE